MTGIVANIQRYTIHDGPGVRTEIFLKGCPLHCKWCSNPETIFPKPELGVYPTKCMGEDACGSCKDACPEGGKPLRFRDGKLETVDRTACTDCLACTADCFLGALKPWGTEMTVEQVMTEVLADRTLYQKSGGGMTLSGGEVTVQADFAYALLAAAKEEGIHTCVESALFCKWETLEKLLPLCDFFITDLKLMDTAAHKQWCGVDNGLILENLTKLAATGLPLVVRIPVVPEVNDGEENLRATAAFLKENIVPGGGLQQVQLLPYRRLGEEKYASLGRAYPLEEPPQSPTDERLRELTAFFKAEGLPVAVGAGTKTKE